MVYLSSVEDELEALNKKLEQMMRRLDYFEAILTESRQYSEVAQLMGDLRLAQSYVENPLNSSSDE